MEPSYEDDSQSPDQPERQLVVIRWPMSARAVGRARGELREALCGWELEGLADTAELVLSELMTNAVRHARTPRGRLIETRYERREEGVRIEVHDASHRIPLTRRAAEEDEAGRGLALVGVLTGQRWGVSSRDGVGKLVWAHVG
ncbi:ATP-binding protein [Streptomyces sp. NPDC021224]|uniref:ATP-binding protein n=1 Tax=unclassified Streptomyces TaxID=2593676 RepID=UPI00379CBB8C